MLFCGVTYYTFHPSIHSFIQADALEIPGGCYCATGSRACSLTRPLAHTQTDCTILSESFGSDCWVQVFFFPFPTSYIILLYYSCLYISMMILVLLR